MGTLRDANLKISKVGKLNKNLIGEISFNPLIRFILSIRRSLIVSG